MMKNKNVVKVIFIYSKFVNVVEVKEIVYNEYKYCFYFEYFYV